MALLFYRVPQGLFLGFGTLNIKQPSAAKPALKMFSKPFRPRDEKERKSTDVPTNRQYSRRTTKRVLLLHQRRFHEKTIKRSAVRVSVDVTSRPALRDLTRHDDPTGRHATLLDAREQQRHRLVDHFREWLADRRQIIGFA